MEIAHVKKRIEPAFVEVLPCTLSSEEVEIVYLALTRLQEIEKAGERRDIAEIQALLGWDAPIFPNAKCSHGGTPLADTTGSTSSDL